MDTMNKFMVSVTAGKILMMNLPRAAISKDEALILAAWLVALADDSEDHETFDGVLTAVELV